jgi:hypothetical protein
MSRPVRAEWRVRLAEESDRAHEHGNLESRRSWATIDAVWVARVIWWLQSKGVRTGMREQG